MIIFSSFSTRHYQKVTGQEKRLFTLKWQDDDGGATRNISQLALQIFQKEELSVLYVRYMGSELTVMSVYFFNFIAPFFCTLFQWW